MRLPRCPVCGTARARRIVYGLPTSELFDDPDVALGGCMVAGDDPRFRCRKDDCAHEWR